MYVCMNVKEKFGLILVLAHSLSHCVNFIFENHTIQKGSPQIFFFKDTSRNTSRKKTRPFQYPFRFPILAGRIVTVLQDFVAGPESVPIWRFFFLLRASHHVLIVYEKPQTNLCLYFVSFVPYLVTSALIPSVCSENNSTSSSSLSSARRGRAFLITNVAKL